eukprot:scaffold71841_cov76-Phaeocystis_antarctica.AAC.1
MPSSLPSATSAASAPDADATAHSTPAAGPRISTLSTANGRRSGRLQRVVEVSRVNLRARQRGAPPQPCRRLAATLPSRLQQAERGAVFNPHSRERSVKRRGVGHVAAPLSHRRQVQWPPRRRVRSRPMSAAVHRRHCLARAATHLKRAALKQRTLHPSRATLLQHQRLQEEHAAQRRACRRGGGRGRACPARRLQVASTRENNAPTHDVVGHERVQRPGHRRTEEGGAARGCRWSTL